MGIVYFARGNFQVMAMSCGFFSPLQVSFIKPRSSELSVHWDRTTKNNGESRLRHTRFNILK